MNTGLSRHSRCTPKKLAALAEAARDKSPVSGWTHNFYRYPARFSPNFAAAAIRLFSHPGDLVIDPYMGGGTTLVEGVALGRHVVGNDLNSLATFVARVKVRRLTLGEQDAITQWAIREVPQLSYSTDSEVVVSHIHSEKAMLGVATRHWIGATRRSPRLSHRGA